MSDFLAIVVSGDTVLHVVDAGRPVWFIPGQIHGLRVIPDPQYFLTDALAVLRDGALDKCDSSCRSKKDSLNDFSENHVCTHILAAREKVRNSKDHQIIVLHNSELDSTITEDLEAFSNPPVVQQLFAENGDQLGLV